MSDTTAVTGGNYCMRHMCYCSSCNQMGMCQVTACPIDPIISYANGTQATHACPKCGYQFTEGDKFHEP